MLCDNELHRQTGEVCTPLWMNMCYLSEDILVHARVTLVNNCNTAVISFLTHACAPTPPPLLAIGKVSGAYGKDEGGLVAVPYLYKC